MSAFCVAPGAKESGNNQEDDLKPQNLFNKVRIGSLEERNEDRDRRHQMQDIDIPKFNPEDKNYMSFEMKSQNSKNAMTSDDDSDHQSISRLNARKKKHKKLLA